MAGTKEGGKQAAQTNKAKHGVDFYKRIGQLGGSTKPTKPRGFATMTPERLREVSIKGGKVSPTMVKRSADKAEKKAMSFETPAKSEEKKSHFKWLQRV